MHRPQTCRSYDCRVFPAAGLDAGGKERSLINERVRRWRFAYPSQIDRAEQAAVEYAAGFLRQHAALFPEGFVPSNPAQLAILAIKVYEVFLHGLREPPALADAVVAKLREFETRGAA